VRIEELLADQAGRAARAGELAGQLGKGER
jgi:hypothetical protein